jgi:predicted GIY-YIG superfamily endonuclease
MIYLIKSEARNGTFYKIGATQNLEKRMRYYATHNPNAKLIEVIATYKKTKFSLEKAIHNELMANGYEFVENFEIETEWFFVSMENEKAFEVAGLAQFAACKNRKIIKV